MKFKSVLGVIAAVGGLWMCAGSLFAQDDNGGPGGPPGGGPGGNFDPAQFRQRMMEQTRKNLDVTNDDEWAVIQTLVQKAMDARREAFMGGGMGMGFGGPPPGGGPGGGLGGPGGRGGFGPQPSAEQKELQKVVDANGGAPQIKEALAKFRAARKEKQSKLEAAQGELRNVLTLKQEARAVMLGLLQ